MISALRLPDLNAPPAPPEPPPPDPTALAAAARQEGLEEGRALGHAAGLREGRAQQQAAQEAAIEKALEQIAAQLAAAEQAGRDAAEQSTEALATLVMEALDLALPGAAARQGPDLVAHLVVPLLSAIADRPEAVLHVAPGLVAPIAARLPPGAPQVVADADVPPGDARLVWRDGGVLIDLASRRAAIAETLRACGIGPDDENSQENIGEDRA